jgi:hypothetical protein
VTAQPQPEVQAHCELCGGVVALDARKCPACGNSRPAARGRDVLGRDGLWMLAGMLVAVYAVVLAVVAAAR